MRKRKKKKILILVISILIIIVLGIFTYQYFSNKLIIDIKKHYSKFATTIDKVNIYDKNKKNIGTISKGFDLELEKDKNPKKRYFKIKDTPYYIFYKDIKKIDSYKKGQINNHYLPLNKNIEITKKVLLKNETVAIELNKDISLPVYYIKDNNYVVYYMGKVLQVEKSKAVKEVKTKGEIENSNISIIHYENISNNCNGYDCIKPNNVKEQINMLNSNGYYSITLDEYKSFLNGDLNLKNKAILYTTANQSDFIDKINTELGVCIEIVNEATGLKFNSTNQMSKKNNSKEVIDRYQIKKYSTLENILKMAQGESVIEKAPIIKNGAGQGIPVLNYHFFYDPNQNETCNEGICLTVQKFEEQLLYLKNNGYRTLTMSEFREWMFNELDLPEKSVLITIDDGAMGTGKHNGNKLIPLLEKYDLHATLFLITGWWNLNNYISPNLDVQSHTNDMHQYGTCGKGQINCYSYDEALADLKQSISILGNSDSFCFPFYSYSEKSLQAVKDAGFKIAFVGGNRKATRNDNKYLIPRYPIHSDITIERFINIVS